MIAISIQAQNGKVESSLESPASRIDGVLFHLSTKVQLIGPETYHGISDKLNFQKVFGIDSHAKPFFFSKF